MAADGGATPAGNSPREPDWIGLGQEPRPSSLHPPTRSVEPWTEEAWVLIVDSAPSPDCGGECLLNGGTLVSGYRRYPDSTVGTYGLVDGDYKPKYNQSRAEWAPVGTLDSTGTFTFRDLWTIESRVAMGMRLGSSLETRDRYP